MLTQDETERCLVCRMINLRILDVRLQIDEGAPTLLVFHNLLSKAGQDDHVKSLALVVCLGRNAVVVRRLSPSIAHTVAKNLSTSCMPLAVRRYVSVLYRMSH